MASSKSSNLSAARLAANRRNALKSTGPKTAAGKRRVALNRHPAESLCSPELERDLRAHGEDPRDFRRLHRDLIAIFRPGDWWEKGGVETLAFVWWQKARRIRGWVGAGEVRCDDLDAQLDELIRLLVLKQSSQHQWWKVRLNSVLGYGPRSPEEIRLRIERRLFAFGGRPARRRYPGKSAQGKTQVAASPCEDALSRMVADVMSGLGASPTGTGNEDALSQIMADAMAAMAGAGSQQPPTGSRSQPTRNGDLPCGPGKNVGPNGVRPRGQKQATLG